MFSAEEGEKALGETGVRTGILPTVEVKDEVKDEVPQSM